MATTLPKEVLTTGEVARLCHVAPRTVSKWFDTGQLRGYRIPGSRDRRIPLAQVQAFMRAHGIPMDAFDGGSCRVLVLGCGGDPVWQALRGGGRYDVRTAVNGFEAGMAAQQYRPHVIVIGVTPGQEEEAAAICRNIKSSGALSATKVLAAVTDDSRSRPWLTEHGFDECLAGSLSLGAVRGALEQATNLLS